MRSLETYHTLVAWLRPASVVLTAVLFTSAQDTRERPRFRVSVDAVSIDAVVTDRAGHLIPDLTAGDFEVFQDGKKQKVLFAQFVPVSTAMTAAARGRASAPADAPSIAPGSARRQDIQRTIAVVIDDLGLSFESTYYVKRGLHRFIDEALVPTDLVAVLRTATSTGALQAFTTDRRILHAAVEHLQWSGLSRKGVSSKESLNLSVISNLPHPPGREGTGGGFSDAAETDPEDSDIDALRASLLEEGTFGALSLIIQGTSDLPGRKAIILVTEGFTLRREGRGRDAVDRLLNQAARAGVVIYCLDARGLQTLGLGAADDTSGVGPAGIADALASQVQGLRGTQEGMAYLAEQSGGFAVLNTNDLGKGLDRIADSVRDYYVIGYQPDAATFKLDGKEPRLHNVRVNVLRPGLRVRTPKEFLGVSDRQPRSDVSPGQALVQAATSPFAARDILLRATLLPSFSPSQGMFVRAILHIDARGLAFKDDGAGRKTASADLVALVFDQNAADVAHLSSGFEAALTGETENEALRQGLVYTLQVPIRRAGGYQARFAIRDRASGMLGSAGAFVEMPDIVGGRFALSGLILRKEQPPKETALLTSDQFAATSAQTLRTYQAGARLWYTYEVYNAGQEVTTTVSVWRGSQKIMSMPAGTLDRPASGTRRFAAAGALQLGDALPSGAYLLEVSAVTPDEKHPHKLRAAVQRIDFEVR